MTGVADAEGLSLAAIAPRGRRLSAAAGDVGSEHSLAQRFARGEPDAFSEVVALYQTRVERLADRLLGWRGDVNDAVQDVFLAALQNARRVRGDRGLWPWLAAITINACRTQRRQHWTRLRFLRGQPASPPASVSAADARPERDETLGRVRDAIARLPRADREVVVLRHLEGLHPADIAAVLGTSPGAVEVRLSRARQRLKGLLGDLSEA